MKYAILLLAGAALALGACQESAEPDLAAPDTGEATEAAAAAPAAPSGSAAFTAGQPPSKEFMVGIWGEGEECELPIDFQAGGTVKDGPVDTWDIANGKLVMDDLIELNVRVVDAETMETQPDGETEWKTIKRCG